MFHKISWEITICGLNPEIVTVGTPQEGSGKQSVNASGTSPSSKSKSGASTPLKTATTSRTATGVELVDFPGKP
ncbi:hypothetical protein [Actinotignum urinale]|uniref:Uncharacterized protein n=1 Tax=Actinotignum urinale TaxID=190146 RepID=A0ABU5G6A2_9ACTO|nr:hypothetical protein [Actinotignum urinale]MDY5132680.1 hypothetical protein [Actinotignum urinale]